MLRKHGKLFHAVYYARKKFNGAQRNNTVTKLELLALVYAFEKLSTYLLGIKVVVSNDHAIQKYLLAKKNSKPWLIRLLLLFREFDFEVKIKDRVTIIRSRK